MQQRRCVRRCCVKDAEPAGTKTCGGLSCLGDPAVVATGGPGEREVRACRCRVCAGAEALVWSARWTRSGAQERRREAYKRRRVTVHGCANDSWDVRPDERCQVAEQEDVQQIAARDGRGRARAGRIDERAAHRASAHAVDQRSKVTIGEACDLCTARICARLAQHSSSCLHRFGSERVRSVRSDRRVEDQPADPVRMGDRILNRDLGPVGHAEDRELVDAKRAAYGLNIADRPGCGVHLGIGAERWCAGRERIGVPRRTRERLRAAGAALIEHDEVRAVKRTADRRRVATRQWRGCLSWPAREREDRVTCRPRRSKSLDEQVDRTCRRCLLPYARRPQRNGESPALNGHPVRTLLGAKRRGRSQRRSERKDCHPHERCSQR